MEPAPAGSNRTAPALVAPLVAAQAIFWSGTCSRTAASHSRRTPAISATQCSRWSPFCCTSLTPPMKCGKSSNWVHWSYAVRTGTWTSIDRSTLVVTPRLLVCGLRVTPSSTPGTTG